MGKRKHSSDDSSSEEDVKPSKAKEESDSSSSSDGDGEWNAKPASKAKAKKKIKSKKQAKSEPKIKTENEEREEGECDDDESDDDEDVEEFNDGYDENFMGDEADKTRLAEMTEKEREQELFNRGEKREVLRTRFEIEKKLRLQKKKEQQKRDFTESTLRSNERRKNMEDKSKKKDTLNKLKEQREKKKQKQQKLRAVDVYSSSSDSDDDDGKKKKSSSSSSSSSSDSSDDSDNEGKQRKRGGRRDDDYGSGRGSDDERNDNYVVTLEDINSIRVSRFKIEKWCHSPFFGLTTTGCFVRLGLGQNPQSGKQVYRMAQISDVLEGPKIYSMNPPTNTVKTNKVFRLKHGRDERQFRLEYVSNQPIEANEFIAWKERLEKEKVDLPTRSHVELKKKDLANALDYRFNDGDIDAILKEKLKFNKTPKNYAVKKTFLMKMKDEAEQSGDQVELQRITEELDTLEERAKELDKQRTHSIAAISYINERNRLKNIADTEKAIIEDREARVRDGIVDEDDPFRRRNCRPTLVHKFNKSKPGDVVVKTENGSAQDDIANGEKVKQEPGTVGSGADAILLGTGSKPLVTIPIKLEKSPVSPPRTDKNDLFSAHDFDIQIDFELTPGASMAHNYSQNHSFGTYANLNATPAVKAPNRRSLNLEEYKKKKGLI